MAVTTNDKNSYSGIVEYSWEGTSDVALSASIEAIGAHLQIVQISFSLTGTGSASEEFTSTLNHLEGSDLDIEFFSQNMSGQRGVIQRWANDAGIYIPKGSTVDFAWTNTDVLAWGLSVLVRNE